MFEQLINFDKTIFLFLNNLHSSFFDPVMITLSAKAPWVPLYIAIALAFFFTFRWENNIDNAKPRFIISRRPIYFALIAVMGAVLTFALTDMLSSQIKDLVARPRPAYDPVIGSMVRLLEYKGGLYGFLSSHAANVFGLAMFTSLIFHKKYYSFAIFFWAAMVSYSRIYVGKHFPLDVICGALFGAFIGWTIFLIVKTLFERLKIKSI